MQTGKVGHNRRAAKGVSAVIVFFVNLNQPPKHSNTTNHPLKSLKNPLPTT